MAYILTFVDSLADNSRATSMWINGQVIGSVWLRLLAVVVGWLQLSPKCDFGRLRSALNCASAMSYVASHQGAVLTSDLSNKWAISIDVHGSEKLYSSDEGRTPPILNYARALPWATSAEEGFTTFRLVLENAWARRPVNPTVEWHETGREGIHPDNRVGDPDAIDAYCKPPESAYRSHWASGIFTRMLVASFISATLQWETIGAAVVFAWNTPPEGLGCLSGAYTIYGLFSAI